MRRAAASFGLFAVLLQALLFGWHHHDIRVSGRLPWAVVENPAASPQALDDEDRCEICQVLHHQSATSVDFAAAPRPLAVADRLVAGHPAIAARSPALAFRARAPPSLDAAIG
jgi:hypothetical protein